MPIFRIPAHTAILISLAVAFPAISHGQTSPAANDISPRRIVISGSVPDESTKSTLLKRLQDLYGTGQVIDQVSVGGVIAPPNWSNMVPRLITENLKSIIKGQLVVEGTMVSLRGEVGNDAMRQSISTEMANTLNSSYSIKNGLRVTPTTQSVIDKALANRIIEFEHGSALLTDAGKIVLEEMLSVLQQLKTSKFEVIGHTDNVGAASRNLALSRARAESVKNYLVAKGIPSQVIATSGMGADQPLYSNDTEDGRRKNRRIEFRLAQ